MIRDRVLLGTIAGTIGGFVKVAVNEAFAQAKISQRTFRSLSAGMWLPTRKQVESPKGQLLGLIFDFGMNGLGGIGAVQLLTSTGKDQIITKGLVYGIGLGSIINAIISGGTKPKIASQDADSNLAQMAAHAAFGLTIMAIAAKLGDPSLFTETPLVSDAKRVTENIIK